MIKGTQEGFVPLASPEGRQADNRQLKRKEGVLDAKRQEMLKTLEERGMEDLATSEKRLMKPLKDRLASLASERLIAKSRLANPIGSVTIFGGMDMENVNRQVKEFVERQERILERLNAEESSVSARMEEVAVGMADVAVGKRPSDAFVDYLDSMEAEAAKAVRDSADRGSGQSDEAYVPVRENLKAIADLKASSKDSERVRPP